MKLPITKKNDGWLDIALKTVVVLGICCAVLAYVFTIRPVFKSHKALMKAERRLHLARQGLLKTEQDAMGRRETLLALDSRIGEKRKELSWIEISLEKKAVEKTFLEEELADIENRFSEVKVEAICAYLLKLTGDAIQASVQQGDNGGLKPVNASFDVREYVIRISRETCRINQEGSYRFVAAKLFERFALEKLPKKGSNWEDLVTIVNWYPAHLPSAGPGTAHGG